MIPEPSKTQQAINQLNGSLEEAASLDKQIIDLALETLAKNSLSSQEFLSLQSLQNRISKLDHPPSFSSLIQKKLQEPISISDATQKVFQLFPHQQQTIALLVEIEQLLKKPNTHAQSVQDILKLIPPNERTSSLFQSLCLLDLSAPFANNIQRTISLIPENQRSGLLQQAAPIISSFSYGYTQTVFLYATSKIPQNQRNDSLLQDLKVLFQKTDDIKSVAQAIDDLKEDVRVECIQDTVSFLSKVSCQKNQAKILTAMSQIPPSQRQEAISPALPLLTQTVDGSHQSTILVATSEIRQGPKSDVIEKVRLFREGCIQARCQLRKETKESIADHFDEYTIKYAFQAIDETHQSQRQEIMAMFTLLWENFRSLL